jgi:hypothetical protein
VQDSADRFRCSLLAWSSAWKPCRRYRLDHEEISKASEEAVIPYMISRCARAPRQLPQRQLAQISSARASDSKFGREGGHPNVAKRRLKLNSSHSRQSEILRRFRDTPHRH